MTFHSEYGQDRWLAEHIFADKCDGAFVEAGALDGLLHSNTLFFERERNWRGVLIEAHPDLVPSLRRNRPRASVVGCALGDVPGVAQFILSPVVGWSGLGCHSHQRREQRGDAEAVLVPVLPLADVLRGIGIRRIDYLSLDIEGGELAVLARFPFDEIPIRVIGIEDNDGNNVNLRALLAGCGYHHLARVGVDEFWQIEG